MHNKPFFSVIIPAYNCENYISSSIKSVLKQTDIDFEILVIDDGSTDRTAAIVNEFVEPSVVLIRTRNSGVSHARNVGIQHASGRYILFLDADDHYSDIDSLKCLKASLKADISFPEVLLFGFSVKGIESGRKNDSQVLCQLSKLQDNSVIKTETIKRMLSPKDGLLGYIWRACYSADFLHNHTIKFEESLKISEDFKFLLESIYMADSIKVDPNTYYIYVLNEGSMSLQYVPTLTSDMTFVNRWIRRVVISKYPELNVYLDLSIANTYLRTVQNELRTGTRNLVQQLRTINHLKNYGGFEEVLTSIAISKKHFDLKSRVGLVLLKYRCETIYALLFKLKRKVRKKG